jgi:hypothetical protein
MPYLSSNHRFATKSKSKNLIEAGMFVTFSVFAIFLTIMTMGWISASSSVDESYSQYVKKISDKTLVDYRDLQ